MSRSRSGSRSRSRRHCTTSTRKSVKPGRAESAPKEDGQQDRQQQAHQQAGDDRKVEVDVATVDGDVAQVLAVELAVGADVFLERDAAVLQDLLDPAAALAVGSGVNNDFHLALCLRVLPLAPG